MGRRTLYVRDEDEKLWREAKRLVKGTRMRSLSRLIAVLLGREVRRMKARRNLRVIPPLKI